jgi:hypothetical protein
VVGVKEADRKVVGEEVAATVETDSNYPGLMRSRRKRASQQTIDSHNSIDVLLCLVCEKATVFSDKFRILYTLYFENERKSDGTGKIR